MLSERIYRHRVLETPLYRIISVCLCFLAFWLVAQAFDFVEIRTALAECAGKCGDRNVCWTSCLFHVGGAP